MENPIVGGLLAFAAGFAVSAANFLISRAARRRAACRHAKDGAAQTRAILYPSLIRQLLCLVFLVALYFAAPYLPWERTPLLIGGALGITLPLIFFTALLLRGDTAEDRHQAEENRGKNEITEKKEDNGDG